MATKESPTARIAEAIAQLIQFIPCSSQNRVPVPTAISGSLSSKYKSTATQAQAHAPHTEPCSARQKAELTYRNYAGSVCSVLTEYISE